ncbi:bacteriocin ABC transporter ATP-binding protein [Fictibacillus arsenicus]|uniref:Bacteriocin ABC transporter ATP-binding protein n=1 Tax=Fictibacillus arsenicus TaxID=255247 RepID=A0A1B1Z2J0_9BACL|nr:putative bacteriocin export ABC transporter [Fictibacillus arsenicus]ANX11529.1 bacteriocin ABC transporter ATP-binding protein [Fictibacillus arsenicus]
MTVIELVNVSKTYDKAEILSNMNLKVEQGEMIAIIGESGKGKTTLLNIIGLISKKQSGDLTLFGKKNPSIYSKEAMMLRRKRIGYLFQNYGLVDDETVKWNLHLALEYKKLSKKEKEERIDSLLNDFGLAYLKNKMIYQLSGGEQQRIAIIRLILQESDLILADEPTASLDAENEQTILKYLKQLNEQGKTIVVVTHNKDILPYFSRVISLDDMYVKESKSAI